MTTVAHFLLSFRDGLALLSSASSASGVLSGPEWSRLILTLVHSLWQGALLAVLLVIALRFCAARRSQMRYVLCLTSLAGLPGGCILTWSWLSHSEAPQSQTMTEAQPTVSESALPDVPMQPAANEEARDPQNAATSLESLTDTAPTNLETQIDLLPLVSTIDGVPYEPQASPADDASSISGLWVPLAAGVWLVGVTLMFLRLTAQLCAGQRLRTSAVAADNTTKALVSEWAAAMRLRQRVQVLITDTLRTPAVMGIFRPALLLPGTMLTGLSPDELRLVVIHELAHIRRYDYLVNLLQMLLEAVLFFNPALWWISRQVRFEREACADAAAVNIVWSPLQYANILARLAEQLSATVAPQTPLSLAGRDRSGLVERVRRVLAPAQTPGLRIGWVTLAIVSLCSVAFVLAARRGADVVVEVAERLLTPEERMTVLLEARDATGTGATISSTTDFLELNGIVRTESEEPLPWNTDVHISTSAQNYHGNKSISVDRDGSFSTRVRDGDTHLTVLTEGYRPLLVGPVDLRSSNEFKLVLQKGQPADVRFEDETGEPISDAEATAYFRYSESGALQAGKLKSDSTGVARFNHAGKGDRYHLTVRRSGFQMLDRHEVTLDPSRTQIVRLQRAKAATGVILTHDGQPASQAHLVLYAHAPPQTGRYDRYSPQELLTVTDDNGHYTLDTLKAGTRYTLTVQTPSHGQHLVQDVEAGQQDRQIGLGPELVIEGTVTGDLSALVLKRENIPYSPNYKRDDLIGRHALRYTHAVRFHEVSQVDEAVLVPLDVKDGVGHFRIGNLLPGVVHLYGGDRSTKVRLTEPIRNFVFNLDDKPTRGRRLVLRFHSPDASVDPVGSVFLQMHVADDSSVSIHESLPITDGKVEVDCFSPGRVHFRANAIVGHWFQGESLTIDSGDDEIVHNVDLFPAGAISGQIRNADGTPVSRGTEVRFGTIDHAPETFSRHYRDAFQRPRVDSQGRYFISPVPLGGTYYVYARDDRMLTAAGPVAIDESKPTATVNLVFPNGTTISGRVLGPEGHAVKGVDVRPGVRFFTHSWGMVPVTSGEDGRFSAGPINAQAGEYSISVEPRTYYQPINVKVPDISKPVTIRLKRGLTAKGVVIDRKTGWPIPGVDVYAVSNDNPIHCEAEFSTDRNGRFQFSNLPSGKSTFRVRQAYGAEGSVFTVDPASGPLTFRVEANDNLVPRKP